MDLLRFKAFSDGCSQNLSGEVDKILQAGKEKKACAIGFFTTDDFYGFYLSWNYENNIEEYYDWQHGSNPDFLYQPLVDVVEGSAEIDFCNASEEKWDFATALLTVLEKNIKEIPDEIFEKNSFSREAVLFFATMSDGDYIDEMLETSVEMFNSPETRKAYGMNPQ